MLGGTTELKKCFVHLPLPMVERLDQYAGEAKCSRREMIEAALEEGLQDALAELEYHTAGRARARYEAYMKKIISKDI